MKAKKKTNHSLEEADKIEQIPEEKNDGHDEPIKAKKPKKNRFLACLRKTWARVTGCMRCCTSIQVERSAEELPGPSGFKTEEELLEPREQEFPSPSRPNMEEELPESSNIKLEEYLGPSEISMEEELPGLSQSNMEEELPGLSRPNVEEELPGPSDIKLEELPSPIGYNMEDSKDMFFTTKLSIEVKEDNMEENQNNNDMFFTASNEVKTDNMEENQNNKTDTEKAEVVMTDSFVEKEIETEYQRVYDLIHSLEDLYIQYYASQEVEVVTDSFVEKEIEAEYQRVHDLIHSLDDLYVQYYASQQEILATYDHINNLIQITDDLHIQYYDAVDEEQQNAKEELESKVDDAEEKIKEDGEDGLEKADSTKESQRASGEMPGPSHISNTGNESSKGKDKEDNKGEENSININEEREECRSEQMSSSKSSSLEEETPEELCESIETSQSGSSHDEESSTSDISWENTEQPGEETSSTVPLTLQYFTFHQKLGKGGFGEVFLASDIIRKECVAIKVSNKCLFTERGYSFGERDILELSHESPFLIHGLAAFHTQNFVYYVMELATRGDLQNFIHKNFPLDTPTIQFIISEVICGTQFLHKKDMLHRDLKPANILLTADGHVKITDFGLSVIGGYERIKEKRRGTPAYMAPEMLRRGLNYGQGVDYFAIGVMLYKMYTSNLPFPGQTPREVKHAIIHNTPLYPEFLTPVTVAILEGLLCKDQYYRLGVIEDIKKHQFFSDINWEDVEARRMEPPVIMTAASVDLNMDQTLDYMEMPNSIRPEDQIIFEEFSFVCPDWSQQYYPVNDEAFQ